MAASMLSAIVWALLRWVFIYFFVVHLYVYWNWNATDGSPPLPTSLSRPIDKRELEKLLAVTPLQRIELIPLEYTDPLPPEEISIEAEYNEQMAALTAEKSKVEDELDQLEKEVKEWQKHKEDLEKAIAELKSMVKSMQSQLFQRNNIWVDVEALSSRVHQDMGTESWAVDGTVESTAATELTQYLTEITDLSKHNVTYLEQRLDRIINALDEQTLKAGEVAWRPLVEAALRSDYPKKTSSPVNVTCPEFLPSHVSEDEESLVLSEEEDDEEYEDEETQEEEEENGLYFPTEQDVKERLEELRSMLYQAYEENFVPLVLSPGLGRLAELRDSLVKRWTQKATSHVETALATIAAQESGRRHHRSGTGNNNKCLDNLDQVDQIWDAGVRALERKQDLNMAILQALDDQGVDASKIILDAVFEDAPVFSGAPPPWLSDDASKRFPLTWRQVLDNTRTKAVTHFWLPFVLDAIGGYNDFLDSWLDQTLGSSDEVLQQLLDAAGQRPLPPAVQGWFFRSLVKSRITPRSIVPGNK